MGYRCWLTECSQEILNDEEVWRDRHGNIVNWEPGTIPEGPAPYHSECGEKFAASRPDWTMEDLIERLPSPKTVVKEPPKGQINLF